VSATEESWKQHFTAHPEKGGVPRRERFLGHHAEALWPAFAAPRPSTLKALLLMGAPASGKSSLSGLSLVPAPSPDVVEVNPDDFKQQLPEYDGGKGASAVHEESSWLAAQARAVAIGRARSLLNDAVGSNLGKYAELIRRLRLNGYTIQLTCVHVLDVEEVVRRVAFRGAKTGRWVREDVVREAHRKIPTIFTGCAGTCTHGNWSMGLPVALCGRLALGVRWRCTTRNSWVDYCLGSLHDRLSR
jgi:predicted ABC-type ATPase